MQPIKEYKRIKDFSIRYNRKLTLKRIVKKCVVDEIKYDIATVFDKIRVLYIVSSPKRYKDKLIQLGYARELNSKLTIKDKCALISKGEINDLKEDIHKTLILMKHNLSKSIDSNTSDNNKLQ